MSRNSSRNYDNNSNRNKRVKSPLMRSILARDWQKVLIRARLVPHEVHDCSVLEVPLPLRRDHEGVGRGTTTVRGNAVRMVRVRVLPLHAACALRPPPEVVRALLSYAVGSAFGRRGHRRAGPGRQPRTPILLFHEHNTSLATVAVGRPDETGLGRAIVDKLCSLGSMARRSSRGDSGGGHGNLGLLCSTTEEDDHNDTDAGEEESKFVGWGSDSRDPPGRRENEKDVALFLKKMEDHLASNGKCQDGDRETGRCSESVGSSHPRRSPRSIFVLDFDPSVLLPSPSAVRATEKQPRGPNGHPGSLRDPPITNRGWRDDGLISLENSIGDVDTAMTTSTPRLIGDAGSRRNRNDGAESSSLEYLTDESGSSDSSGSSFSTLRPPPDDCDDSDAGSSGSDSDSDSNSFLQLTADGGLALVDVDDSTNSSGHGHTNNDTNTIGGGGGSDPLVSTSTSESFVTNGSGNTTTDNRPPSGTSSDSRTAKSPGKVVPEDIQLSSVDLLRSLPGTSRRKRGTERSKVVNKEQTGKPAVHQKGDEVYGLSRLLPLHIACLYGASASVLKVLLQEYPEGSSIEVLGMLPVHMIAANWSLEPSEESVRNDGDDGDDSYHCSKCSDSTKNRLAVLVESSPRKLWAISSAHGLRPLEYIRILLCYPSNASDERIRSARDYLDSKEKGHNICFREQSETKPGGSRLKKEVNDRYCSGDAIEPASTCTTSGSTVELDGVSSTGLANDSFSMYDPSTSDSREWKKLNLNDLLTRGVWKEAISLLEMNPKAAKEPGSIRHQNSTTTDKAFGRYNPMSNLDRRTDGSLSPPSNQEGLLPIHLVCRIFRSGSSVPLALVRSIVSSHPEGLRKIDGQSSRSLPLHLICDSFRRRRRDRTDVTGGGGGSGGDRRRFVAERLVVLQLLLREHPAATRSLDGHGRLALHRAILAGAPFQAIRMLVCRDPKAIALPDRDGATPFCLARKVYPRDSCVVKLLELAWI